MIRSTRRSFRALFALAFVLGGLSWATSPASPHQENRNSFKHENHVQFSWLSEPEVARDCRGCHYTQEQNRPTIPNDLCYVCHTIDDGSTFRVEDNAENPFHYGPFKDEGLFRHDEHSPLACRECHSPGNSETMDPMPVARGSAECARCHDESAPKMLLLSQNAPADETKRRIGFLNSINNAPREGLGSWLIDGAEVQFDHRDHMKEVSIPGALEALMSGETNACFLCHESVATSGSSDLYQEHFDVTQCGTCHRDATKALEFTKDPIDRAVLSCETFGHDVHLGFLTKGRSDKSPCNDNAYDSIESRKCLACHTVEPSEVGKTPKDWNYLSQGQNSQAPWSYDGCIACHDSSSFKTKNHGDWDGCIKCHQFAGESFREDRAMDQVAREPRVKFQVTAHAHPFITKDSESSDDSGVKSDCKQCHRSELDTLNSRLRGVSFRHETHLAPDATSQDCESCHNSMATSNDPRTLGTNLSDDVETYRIYDPTSCVQCHRGEVLPVTTGSRPGSSIVPRFAHSDHLNKDSELACTSCHQLANGDAWPDDKDDVVFAEGVLTCVACHNHDSDKDDYLVTGGVRGEEVSSCALCHSQGIPEIQSARSQMGIALGFKSGAQFHPQDQDCASCHSSQIQRVTWGDSVTVRDGIITTGTSVKSDVHAKGRPDGVECIQCHWNTKADGMTTSDGAPLDPREFRDSLGNQIDGFPGK